MTPSENYAIHLTKIFILKCKGIIEKNSYELLVFEDISHKSTESKTRNERVINNYNYNFY